MDAPDPELLEFSPSQSSGAELFAPPCWAPTEPSDEGCVTVCMCVEAQDLSALFLFSSENECCLSENRDTNHTASLEGLPQLCGFVLWGSCVSPGGCGRFGRLSKRQWARVMHGV